MQVARPQHKTFAVVYFCGQVLLQNTRNEGLRFLLAVRMDKCVGGRSKTRQVETLCICPLFQPPHSLQPSLTPRPRATRIPPLLLFPPFLSTPFCSKNDNHNRSSCPSNNCTGCKSGCYRTQNHVLQEKDPCFSIRQTTHHANLFPPRAAFSVDGFSVSFHVFQHGTPRDQTAMET